MHEDADFMNKVNITDPIHFTAFDKILLFMADWYLWFCCCKTIKKTDQMFSKRAGKLYKIYKQGKKKIDYDLN